MFRGSPAAYITKKLTMDMPMNNGIMYSSLLTMYLKIALVRKLLAVAIVIRSCFHCPATVFAINPSTNEAMAKVIIALSMLGEAEYGHAMMMLFTAYIMPNKTSPWKSRSNGLYVTLNHRRPVTSAFILAANKEKATKTTIGPILATTAGKNGTAVVSTK